jgi:hypothetical protein
LTIRQIPGPDNSLGLVKLVLPHENDVYLHDTPATRLFARSRRDFSHGCIRVEKPAELAAWALRNNPGWTLESVYKAMQQGKDNVAVYLAKRIADSIVYGTTIVYESAEVHFSEDIYGFDSRLAAALAKGYPYTRFAYSGLIVTPDEQTTVTFTVSNTGNRAGIETAQVYASLPESAGEPPKRLVGSSKIQLEPGESKQVSVAVNRDRLSIFDESSNAWKLVPGKYVIHVGSSSRDLPLEKQIAF